MKRTVALASVMMMGLITAGCRKKGGDAGAGAASGSSPTTPDAAAAPADAELEAESGPLTPPVAAGRPGIQILGVEYEGYEAPLLPAIRDDGGLIAAVSRGDDGGRGYLDLALRIVDGRTGKLVEDRRLVDPDETTAAGGDDGGFDPTFLASVRTRVAEANAMLGAATWRPLELHEADLTDPEAPVVAAGINWTLDPRLHLIGTRAGKTVFDRGYVQLTGKPAPRVGDDDDMCPDVIVLSGVHVDEATSTALVTFGRQPGHNCGAPGDDLAVIALPR